MLKRVELLTPTSCLNKAAPEEPIFVLRAKDPLAAQTVRLWATMADGIHEPVKIAEAALLAEQMDKWRAREVPEAAPQPTRPQCIMAGCRGQSAPDSGYCPFHRIPPGP